MAKCASRMGCWENDGLGKSLRRTIRALKKPLRYREMHIASLSGFRCRVTCGAGEVIGQMPGFLKRGLIHGFGGVNRFS